VVNQVVCPGIGNGSSGLGVVHRPTLTMEGNSGRGAFAANGVRHARGLSLSPVVWGIMPPLGSRQGGVTAALVLNGPGWAGCGVWGGGCRGMCGGWGGGPWAQGGGRSALQVWGGNATASVPGGRVCLPCLYAWGGGGAWGFLSPVHPLSPLEGSRPAV